MQDNLVRLQPGFKTELLVSVEVFQKDVTDYTCNYDEVRITVVSYYIVICKECLKTLIFIVLDTFSM